MPARFDDVLRIETDGSVTAAGPIDQSVSQVTELCVWVVQRTGGDADDAIANAMGPGPQPATSDAPQTQDMPMDEEQPVTILANGAGERRWIFPLKDRITTKPHPPAFSEGQATATAIGVFIDTDGHERAFAWSQEVWLQMHAEPGSA
jgi:hypothetical protein